MFLFSKEKPTRIVCQNKAEIIESLRSRKYPWVMTRDFQPIERNDCERVFVVFTFNKYNYRMIGIYPLKPDLEDKFLPPMYEIVNNSSPLLGKTMKKNGTRVCYPHEAWSIIQTLNTIKKRTEEIIKRKNLDLLPESLTSLLEHCYLTDFIGESLIEAADGDFRRLEKTISLANGTSYEGERSTALNVAFGICEKIFNKIQEEIKRR